MPRKPKAKKEPTQKQSQRQTIVVNVGEIKPKRRRAKRAPRKPVVEIPTREFPKTIYQTVPVYIHEDQGRYANLAPIDTTTILRREPVKSRMPILEDLGTIGTEGFTEILDVPTKRETLSELITPVSKPKKPMIDEEGEPIKAPRYSPDIRIPQEMPTFEGMYGERGMIPRATPKSEMMPSIPKERGMLEPRDMSTEISKRAEQKQMYREDIGSSILGLSKFNFEKPKILQEEQPEPQFGVSLEEPAFTFPEPRGGYKSASAESAGYESGSAGFVSESERAPPVPREFITGTRPFKSIFSPEKSRDVEAKLQKIREAKTGKPSQKRTRTEDIVALYNQYIGFPPMKIADYNELPRKEKKRIKDEVERYKIQNEKILEEERKRENEAKLGVKRVPRIIA
jgi:hypothetical protein